MAERAPGSGSVPEQRLHNLGEHFHGAGSGEPVFGTGGMGECVRTVPVAADTGKYVDVLLPVPSAMASVTEENSQVCHHSQTKAANSSHPAKKRSRVKSLPEGSGGAEGGRVKTDSPGRSGKHTPKRSSQDGKSTICRQGEVRADSAGVAGLSSPTPSLGADQNDTGLKASLLDEVLTEKKMALLKSPEVKAFLRHQQTHTAAPKVSHPSK